MKRIAVIALLQLLASLPAYAADGVSPELNLEIPEPPADETARLFVKRLEELSRFGLLQVDDRFALYGRLSLRRMNAAEAGVSHNAASYGLHGQFKGARGVDLHFGWSRYVAGPDPGGSFYTLGATIRF